MAGIAHRARAAAGSGVGGAVRGAWQAATRLGAVRSGHRHARRFYAFGEGSVLSFPLATLLGEDRIAIGAHSMVGAYSTVSAGLPLQPPNPSWAGPTLTIGDRCVIGRGVTILAHREIVIEDDVWTGNDVFVSDQNHAWDDPHAPIGTQAAEPRPVRIGAGAWIGHGAMILPGSVIGRRAVVAAGAVVRGPVDDHAIVAGVPARVVGTTVGAGGTVEPLHRPA